MIKNVKMLDCTLRDGGYINDWDFGHSVLTGIYKRLDAAGVDYIEVGFLDDRRDFDINRSIMPDTDAINKIYGSIEKRQAIPVAMIDYGTCSLDNIGPADSTFIDGIRVIFKKEKIAEALPYCKELKNKGYKLFIQAISITAYSDMEMLEYVQKINEVKPYAFSIVDTYGLLDNKSLTRYFRLIDNNLDPEIKLGYHEHNNFQLGFSNTMKFLSMETTRELVADATVYGMGKSAGNCAIELLGMHLNDYYEKNYNLNLFLEIIDTDLMSIYKRHYWGYKYDFYISAMQMCHPAYVQYLLEKKTLSISSVNEILSTIPVEKKLVCDKEWIKAAYIEYQKHQMDDSCACKTLKEEIFSRKNVLVLGPGNSIVNEKEKVEETIKDGQTVIFTINFFTRRYPVSYVFMSNAKRYSKLADNMFDKEMTAKLLITSNITPLDFKPDYVFNYGTLLNNECENSDNALILLLNLLIKIGVKSVKLAGFDGFSADGENYYERGYDFYKDKSDELNKKISSDLKILKSRIEIKFITETKYVID